MTPFSVTWSAPLPEGTTRVLVPVGLTTPEATLTDLAITGGQVASLREATTGQEVALVTPDASTLSVTWTWEPRPGSLPAQLFDVHPSRHSRAASALIEESVAIAPHLDGVERATAIACATAERFTYGHPMERFTDGQEAVPALGCDVAVGSCVDINTYFLAALRATGFEAAYVTGYFFPTEKRGTCEDGHCWVLTRIDGAVQAWDIAHHLKLGTRDIRPALNPKPGFRAACGYGMGLSFPDLGLPDVKALIEPLCLTGATRLDPVAPVIRLHGHDMALPA